MFAIGFDASTQSRNAGILVPLRRALAVALLLAMTPISANAATIVVTSPDDSDPASAGTCTLRQAILSMNAGAARGNCMASGDAFGSADTITFAASAITGGSTWGTVTLADSGDTSGTVGGTLVVTDTQLSIDGGSGVTIARADAAANNFGILRDTAATGARISLGNVTLRNGKAAYACDGYARGGGICIPAADLVLVNSTLSGNSAENNGGGIFMRFGALTLTNSTLSGNSSAYGGAVFTNGTVKLDQATVSQNTATAYGGRLDGYGSGTIDRSIVAGNAQIGGDINLTGWSGSHNLTSATGLDLGPLQNNGGPTPTMLPGIDSAAIDAIPLAACTQASDQRGVSRPQGAGCDIGAVEVQPDRIFVDGFDGAPTQAAHPPA